MKFRCEYRYTNDFGVKKHTWLVIVGKGAIHLHISDTGHFEPDKPLEYYGGIECHWRNPPEYMKDDAPSHDHCWVLKAPCWHDGSSMAATEKWIPLWQAGRNDHEGIFNALKVAAEKAFSEKG